MRFRATILLTRALLVFALLQVGAANASSIKPPKFIPFSFHGRLGGLTVTTGACPGFTCAPLTACLCYSASGSRLNIKGIGPSDMTFNLNVNMTNTFPTGVGGTFFGGEGSGTIIPNGDSANLINWSFGGLNLCHTQSNILLGKVAAALDGGMGANQTIEGIADLAVLISTIEDHIDMELDGNYSH